MKYIKAIDVRKMTPLVRNIVLAFVIFLVAAIGFTALADEVLDGDTLRFDEQVLKAINQTSTPARDQFFVIATEFGGFYAAIIIGIIILVWLLRQKRHYMAMVVAASVAGAGIINVVLKLIFERPRPDLWNQLITEAFFSFPSGHAMASSALAFSVVAALWHTKWRILAMVLGGIYTLIIGYSRLYLGVHYPTDVLGGWLISLAWVAIAVSLVYGFRFRHTVK